jgi:Nicotinate-nucleotide pyrophosphorylase
MPIVTSDWSHPDIRALVELALREDIGAGDVTSAACVPEDRIATGSFFARAEVIVAASNSCP